MNGHRIECGWPDRVSVADLETGSQNEAQRAISAKSVICIEVK